MLADYPSIRTIPYVIIVDEAMEMLMTCDPLPRMCQQQGIAIPDLTDDDAVDAAIAQLEEIFNAPQPEAPVSVEERHVAALELQNAIALLALQSDAEEV
jgi:hypothetical protein